MLFAVLSALLLSLPASAAQRQLNVAVLIYEGVELLDFSGPAETFAVARDEKGEPYCKVFLVSRDGKRLTSQGFVKVTPNYSIKNAPKPDILVIPGGDINSTLEDTAVRAWVNQHVQAKKTVLSVCNGASLLGSLGYLTGKQVATHRGNFEILRALDPSIRILPEAKIVSSNWITTSAGISSGLDGSLYLIAKKFGLKVAQRACTHLEYMAWPGIGAKSMADFIHEENNVEVQGGNARTQEKVWGISTLLEWLAEDEPIAAVNLKYQQLLASSEGHDREMLGTNALQEISLWLYSVATNKKVSLRMAELNAAANPHLPDAQLTLARLFTRVGKRDDARRIVSQILRTHPKDAGALKLSRTLRK